MTDSRLIRVVEPRILPHIIYPHCRQNQPFPQKKKKQTQGNNIQPPNITIKKWFFTYSFPLYALFKRLRYLIGAYESRVKELNGTWVQRVLIEIDLHALTFHNSPSNSQRRLRERDKSQVPTWEGRSVQVPFPIKS
jgi:hypothetical protein